MNVEGYAALFAIADLSGDIIRAGAFRESLRARKGALPMLLEHDTRLSCGVWREAREDGRGLYVRGEIRTDLPGAARAQRALMRGIDGLSIGFAPLVAHRTKAGRMIEEIDLIEVSIVAHPMQPLARLSFARARVL